MRKLPIALLFSSLFLIQSASGMQNEIEHDPIRDDSSTFDRMPPEILYRILNLIWDSNNPLDSSFNVINMKQVSKKYKEFYDEIINPYQLKRHAIGFLLKKGVHSLSFSYHARKDISHISLIRHTNSIDELCSYIFCHYRHEDPSVYLHKNNITNLRSHLVNLIHGL